MGSLDAPVSVAPDNEVEGHPLGPALLLMSPHHAWLATVGRDGFLYLRASSNLVGRDAMAVAVHTTL